MPFSDAYFSIPEEQQTDDLQRIIAFLGHDSRHLDDLLGQHGMQLPCRIFPRQAGLYEKELPPEWQQFYREGAEWLPALLHQCTMPYEFVKAVLEIQMGKKPQNIRECDLQKMIEVIAKTTQLRFFMDDYVITTPDKRQPDRNEIIIDIEELKLITSPGMLWSIFYNLITNAAKELTHHGKDEETSPLKKRCVENESLDKPQKIYIKGQNVDGMIVVHVSDSGEGLDSHELMQSTAKMMEKGIVRPEDFSKPVAAKLFGWPNNPHAIRELKLGQIYDELATAHRVSGYADRYNENPGTPPSSGLGLWGVRYLLKHMGGRMTPTDSFLGGALFSVIIPQDYFGEGTSRTEVRRTVSDLRRRMIQGAAPEISYPAAEKLAA